MNTLWCYLRMLWRGRWVPYVEEDADGWRARHTRTGAIVGGTNTTRQLAVEFCRTANFGKRPMPTEPKYISIEWRVRCDGWWRKTIIGAATVGAVAIIILSATR